MWSRVVLTGYYCEQVGLAFVADICHALATSRFVLQLYLAHAITVASEPSDTSQASSHAQ